WGRGRRLVGQGAGAPLNEAFEGPPARFGARLRLRREQVLDELRGHAARAFAEVARGEQPLRLAYQAAGRDSDGLGDEAGLRGEDELAGRVVAGRGRRGFRGREGGVTGGRADAARPVPPGGGPPGPPRSPR